MKKIFLIMLLVISGTLLAKVELFLEKQPMQDANEKLNIELQVHSGFDEISSATVYYRETGTLSYKEDRMELGTFTNPICTVTLSDIQDMKAGIDYYFVVATKSGTSITLPQDIPAVNPFHSVLTTKKYNSELVRISPDDIFSEPDKDFIIAISYFGLADEINPTSIKLFLDGKNITKRATISNNIIVYRPQKLATGKHIYYVKAKLYNGMEIISKHWSSAIHQSGQNFTKQAGKFDIYGNANLRTWGNSTTYNDTIPNNTDSRTTFTFNVNSRYDWMKFRSHLFISSLEDKKQQSTNRYNFQIMVPYFKLILGDYSPQFGDFIISGKNVRGISTRLDFSDLRIVTTYGSLSRAVDGKLISDSTNSTDTYSAGTFQRKTLAASIEVGSKDGFTYGLGFSKNKDIISSLDEKYYLNPAVDSLNNCIEGEYDENSPIQMPNDNLVLGMHTDWRFMDNRIALGAQTAISLFNSNIIGGAISKKTLEDDLDTKIPVDPEAFETIFVFNRNVEPFKPGKTSMATKAYIRAFFLKNYFGASYSLIGSSFKSLATNYLQTGAQTINLVDNITLLKNQINLNFGINLISDNIYDQQDVTTNTTGYFGNFAYNPPDLPSFRFGISVNKSKNDVEDDPDIKFGDEVDTNINSYNVGMGYEVGKIPLAPTKLFFEFRNTSNLDNAYKSYDNSKNTVTISLKSFFEPIPLITLISYSFTQNKDKNRSFDDTFNNGNGDWSDFLTKDSKYNSFYFKANYFLLDDSLKPFTDIRFTSFAGDIEKQKSTMFNIGTDYTIIANTLLSTSFGIRAYNNIDTNTQNYTNYNWKFQITHNF